MSAAGRSVALFLNAAPVAWAGNEAFNGRKIIAPPGENNGRVLWLEINGAGTGSVTGALVGTSSAGQLNLIRDGYIRGGQLRFQLKRRTSRDHSPLVQPVVPAALADGPIQGVALRARIPLLRVGERAPLLTDRDNGSWKQGSPVPFFDGTGLRSWRTPRTEREGNWYAEDGLLKNRKGVDLLVTRRTCWNFLLEAEYREHPRMNGGIGLRGRYEIQILDDFGRPASERGNGTLCGRIRPTVNASRQAGAWQDLAIRRVGREVTVVWNGVRTVARAVVEGFAAKAADWLADEPGPITLLGDHGAVELRKIVLTPLVQ